MSTFPRPANRPGVRPEIPATCRVGALDQWSRQNHLKGLTAEGGHFFLDNSHFSCCQGSGLEFVTQIDERTDSLTSGFRSCGLTQRLTWLTELIRSFDVLKRGHGDPSVAQVFGISHAASSVTTSSPSKDSFFSAVERWRRLHANVFRETNRGRLIADAVRIPQADADIWPGLASLIWHDGLRILCHRHGTAVPPLATWTALLQKTTDPGHLTKKLCCIVLTDVEKLWDPQRLEELEQVISFASQTMTPLWLVLKSDPQFHEEFETSRGDAGFVKSSSVSSTSRFSEGLANRLSAKQRKPIESWLTSDSALVKLKEVCDLPERRGKKS